MSNENRTSKRMTTTSGFTVIELVATLAVLALLVSAALPQLNGVTSTMRLKNEALALKLFIDRVYTYVLTAREGLSLECAESSLTAYRSGGEIVARHPISQGAFLDLESLEDRKLLLHPSIAASPATLTLRRADRSCRIIVSLRGRVRVAC